ncbi:hypothetical protein [Paludisphaera soli]|uniref:hypothetical protein n=1 Tax=Paludisphaera soli TaxID=2712865 RepID=UPI0013EC73BB|nr:hypothetical protein [Paludisphaera soli]
MPRPLAVLVALGISAFAPAAHAGFLGAQMTVTYEYPDLGTFYSEASFAPSTFTVTDGPGFETVGTVEGATTLPVQFTDSTLTITLNTRLTDPTWLVAAFNGVVFSSSAPLGVVGATVEASTTLAGFDDSRVSFTAADIRIDWNGLTYQDGDQVMIRFAFAPAVPEPAGVCSLALGCIGGLAAARFRRRRAA